MAEDSSHAPASHKPAERTAHEAATPGGPAPGLLAPTPAPALPDTMLGDTRLNERGNGPVRAALFLQMQRAYGNRAVQRFLQSSAGGLSIQRDEAKKEDKKEPKLLTDYAGKFSAAADLIRKSPEALKLVNEAAAAGVKFGGYSEDGPGKRAWPYTSGDTVYVAKARSDPVVSMSDFLFELNNAARAPQFAEIAKEAAKGSKGKLTAKEYAHKIVEQEVEGMLRMGAIWFETKKASGKGAAGDKYDSEFFLAEYQAFQSGKKTKEDLIKDVLSRVRDHEPHKGMTVEQHYMEDFKDVSGGK